MIYQDFIEKIGTLASQDMAKSGVLASLTIAQACLESAYGESDLAIAANNIFGMKATLSGNTWESVWDGVSIYRKSTQEQRADGTIYYVQADFRSYQNISECIRDHSLYLLGAKNGNVLRYAGLKGEMDPKRAAQIIKDGGYATDVSYVSKICKIIETYDLTRFDSKGNRSMKIYLSPSDQTGNKYAAGGTNEAAVCRKIANAAAEALKRNGYIVKVGANGTTYQQRVADSNTWGADVHMPIHSNAGGGDGTVMFAYPTSTGNKYVREVYAAVAAISPGKDDGIRGVKNLYEINQSKAVCVYLEVEFHDNATLAKWIINHVDELGEAIAKGFCKADGKKYKGPSSGGGEVKPKYYVQAGAFSSKLNAEKRVKDLKKAGFEAIVKTM